MTEDRIQQLIAQIECDAPRYVLKQVPRSDGADWEAAMVSTSPQPDEYVRWDELKSLLDILLAEPPPVKIWYPCTCGAEHDTPECPFAERPPPQEAPIPLNAAQEDAAKTWAADDRLWTTQETVEFNLRTFARTILKAQSEPQDAPKNICNCGTDHATSARYGHAHLPWCDSNNSKPFGSSTP